MPHPSTAHSSWIVVGRRVASVAVATILLTPAVSGAGADTVTRPAPKPNFSHSVSFHGYRAVVPESWRVVDLTSHPHACVRFDHPAVYFGTPGDQSACPSRLIGGAPGLLVQALGGRSRIDASRAVVSALPRGAVPHRLLPATGPVSVSVAGADVMVTAVYGRASAPLLRRVLGRGRVTAHAALAFKGSLDSRKAPRLLRRSVPGNVAGLGFDACAAPSQATMDAWHASSDYSAVGVYIGGVSRGCAQPNLTASWVSTQVRHGWHLIPTYVGLQAPCTRFYNRMSYNTHTAWTEGRADGGDAVDEAAALGIGAPSTIYSDVEGYNNTSPSCVAAVLSYVAGWTHGLHERGYDSGVYSSASSGISDLASRYPKATPNQPDDIWIAWWNAVANVDGGSYIRDSLWNRHQRIHQYLGGAYETHGGYRLPVDRDYLDVTTAVSRPRGCPVRVDFRSYPTVRPDDLGGLVQAIQCELAHRGFNPGAATGRVGWRTSAAIRAFKTSRGLHDKTVVGRRAWTALLSGGTKPLLETGSTGKPVERLQRALSASLARPVRETATFGRNTRRAVRQYQRACQLTVDGTASLETWTALQAGR
jgi:hypothetical protein